MVGKINLPMNAVIPKGTAMDVLGQRLVLAKDCVIKDGGLGDYEFTEKPKNIRAAVLALRIEWETRTGRLEAAARGRKYMTDLHREGFGG